MSVKIYCEPCEGTGMKGFGVLDRCPACHGLGFEERGCGNCDRNGACLKIVLVDPVNEKIDYCDKWEAKQ